MRVCVSVSLQSTLLHGSGCNLSERYGVPPVVHHWADLQSVHRFRFYDNIVPHRIGIGAHDSIAENAKCQTVHACTQSMPGFSSVATIWMGCNCQLFRHDLNGRNYTLVGVCRPFSAQIRLYQRWKVRDGKLSVPSEGRLAIYYPQPWPPFCSAATQKRERDREAHLNYYVSTYSRGDNYRITWLKLNRHELNRHASLTKKTANINT